MRSDIYLAAVDGSQLQRLTFTPASDTQPRWSPDGKSLYFVSSRADSPQVWRLSMTAGEPEQITHLPLGVDALEVSPDGRFLVFSVAVFPGKSSQETRQILDDKAKSKASGRIYDRLFFRFVLRCGRLNGLLNIQKNPLHYLENNRRLGTGNAKR